jgi:pimeloyl-ACP methyl ester carboxylesterase
VTDVAEINLHGHRMTYRMGGSGPLLVLIHGITNSSASWEPVRPLLEEHFTVLAPDLLGHGDSAKPRGDYSLGAYASLTRDLMLALGHDRATFVGHSLGGGIAMQMGYQFPERCERLVLVSTGGLGRQVSLFLRAVALPGAELTLPIVGSKPLVNASAKVGGWLSWLGLGIGTDLVVYAQGMATLADIEARSAFVHTARGLIDLGGQRIDARDKLYLSAGVPTLIVWGDHDPVIPARHGIRAHEEMPGSQLEIVKGAGHFPHHHDPEGFAASVLLFVESTKPAQPGVEPLRRLLVEHAAASP